MEDFDLELQVILLRLARDAIHTALGIEPEQSAITPSHPRLRERRAAFVTLTLAGRLRGCIGTLEANEELACVIRDCAVGAALRDPRFTAVGAHELGTIRVSISVLAPPSALPASDRNDLIAQLRPGTDGLVVQSGRHRATFLPQVWEQLPEPGTFIDQLLRKAGLAADPWPADIRFQRYHSCSFSEPLPGTPAPAGPR